MSRFWKWHNVLDSASPFELIKREFFTSNHLQNFQSSIRAIELLRLCSKQKDLCGGTTVHSYIHRSGLLKKDCRVASSLVSMYARCGALAQAAEVVEELPVRDVVCWTALIAGHTQQGHGEKALKYFECMQTEGIFPNEVTFICILKACGSIGAAEKGERIHNEITRQGLLHKDLVLGSTLIDMYIKCGALAKAAQVLEELPNRNVVTWSSLIAGYAQCGRGKEALHCFQQMQHEGLSADTVLFTSILKACGIIGLTDIGEGIYNEIIRQGLLRQDAVIGNAVVDMYAKCGALEKASFVLNQLCARDVVSWSALIAGYVQQGQNKDALACFERMCKDGITPNIITFICILKACGDEGAIDFGEQIHNEIVRWQLLENNIELGTTLLDMYVKCGALAKAEYVLEELPARNVVSWSVIVAGYVQQGYGEEALKCFERMHCDGISPNEVTFICSLKACGIIQAAEKGEQVCNMIVRQGLLGKDVALTITLIGMHAKCGELDKAAKLLDELPFQDVAAWNKLIAIYAEQGKCQEALGCFEMMQHEGISPDPITFICSLKACGSTRAAQKGEYIHNLIAGHGLLEKDVILGNALVDMYAKCGALTKAAEVLDEVPVRDVASWSALIMGYAKERQGKEALKCFKQMQLELSADTIAFACILKACSSIRAAGKGEEFHKELIRQGLLGKDIVLGNVLVDMYVKCDSLAKAARVVRELPLRDAVSWNALITGYAEQGLFEEALKCCEEMQVEGLLPDAVTFTCILKVCGIVGAIDKGQEIHNQVVRYGLLETSVYLGSTLVDMYAKCGALMKAARVLDSLPFRDVISWNALIGGYAQLGQSVKAVKCFQRMQSEGLSPDTVTFTSVLSACSHSGLCDKGEMHFHNMTAVYGITPNAEHHTCMVDLFGRIGEFDKALAIIKELPCFDHLPVWHAVLSACQECGNVKLGRSAFDHALNIDESGTAAYVLMTKLYAAAGVQ